MQSYLPMKRLMTLLIIISAGLLSGMFNETFAQIAPQRQSIDTDIFALRNSTVPEFQWHYDDYLQYAPAALMAGLKACGYEGRSSWGRMLAADAFSYAIMGSVVNGVKYTVRRLRPDGSRHNSFPSGHTATAFMMATMLHQEYNWRSPWFSIGGYTAAAVTGVSRVLNNRHWLTDVMAGAAIGIGSVHLGYFITGLIFKDRGTSSYFEDPAFSYDPDRKHYVAELIFGRRFILGAEGQKQMGILPQRGGLAGVSTDIPLVAGAGVTARVSASSMTYVSGVVSQMYSALAGGFWNLHFARIMELQAKAMAGYAWMGNEAGVDLCAGLGLSAMTDNNFKIKAFADFEGADLSSGRPWLNTMVVGFGTAWSW